MPIHRRLPKRGFNKPFRKEFAEVSLTQIQTAIDAGKLDAKSAIDEAALDEAGLVRRIKDGVRVLGGEIKDKISLQVTGASKPAVAAIEKAGGNAAAVTADLAAYATLDGVAEAIPKPFGSPDILVNAAGINLRQTVEEITPESWDQTLAINLATPFFLARAMIPSMRQKAHPLLVSARPLPA